MNEDLVFFTNACDLVAEITPVSDIDIMLRTIVTKLWGQAYEVIKYETISSLEALKELLKNAYEKPKNVAYLQIELFSARQNYKESVIEYINRIRNLLKEVSEGNTQGKSKNDALIISNNLKEQALSIFLEGVSKYIKVMIKSKNPKTLEEAVQIALAEEKK